MNSELVSMNSLEIAEFLELRHSDVKFSIENLIESGAFSRKPALQVFEKINKLGMKQVANVYPLDNEQAVILVATLFPRAPVAAIHRWQSLKDLLAG